MHCTPPNGKMSKALYIEPLCDSDMKLRSTLYVCLFYLCVCVCESDYCMKVWKMATWYYILFAALSSFPGVVKSVVGSC